MAGIGLTVMDGGATSRSSEDGSSGASAVVMEFEAARIVFHGGDSITFRKNPRNMTVQIGMTVAESPAGKVDAWSKPIPIEDLDRALSSIRATLSS